MFTTPSPEPNHGKRKGKGRKLRPLERLLMVDRRDRWLLEMLVAHAALTTGQATRLGYTPTVERAQQRLLKLAADGWIGRVESDIDVEDTCWLLAPLAAQAYELDPLARTDPPPIPTDPLLISTLRANDFFVDLATYARTHASVDLRHWWSTAITHPLVSPDLTRTRYAEYIHHGRRINFWFEDDDETVSAARFGARLLRYRDVLLRTGLSTVLVRLSTAEREIEFCRDLPRGLHALTIATINPERASTDPQAWWVGGFWRRRALHELPENNQPEFVWEYPKDGFPQDWERPPHPIYDERRPGEEAVADGDYSYLADSGPDPASTDGSPAA